MVQVAALAIEKTGSDERGVISASLREVANAPAIVFRPGVWARLTRLYHASGNLVSHHAVTMDGAGVWHYKCVFEDWLHERLADPSWGGVDSQRVVDRLLGWFGAGRLAHVQGAPVGAAEGSSDALLAFEDAP